MPLTTHDIAAGRTSASPNSEGFPTGRALQTPPDEYADSLRREHAVRVEQHSRQVQIVGEYEQAGQATPAMRASVETARTAMEQAAAACEQHAEATRRPVVVRRPRSGELVAAHHEARRRRVSYRRRRRPTDLLALAYAESDLKALVTAATANSSAPSRTSPRRRGSGRPRRSATRSSARSGDGPSDGDPGLTPALKGGAR